MGSRMVRTLVFWLALFLFLPAGAEADRYIDNGNGTVTDTVTGLMWQKDTARDGIGNYDSMTWQEALSYCETSTLGGHSDWRLPTIKELSSLVDRTRYNPAINVTYFPNTVASYYWSATTYASNPHLAWYVYFDYGYDAFPNYKSGSLYVRAVRGGQSVIGGFGTLEISAPTTVNAGENFSLNVRRLDRFGQLITSAYDRVSLSSSCGPIDPPVVDLVAGVATANARLFNPTTGCEIYARTADAYGKIQNLINVFATWLTSGTLSGKVVDALGQAIAGANVKLQSLTTLTQWSVTSGANGAFTFNDLLPGVYLMWAEVDGEVFQLSTKLKINLNSGTNPGQILKVRGKKPPVLFVPGFEGSDKKRNTSLAIPLLPETDYPDPDKIKIHDPGDIIESAYVNWEDLEDDLEEKGFEVFECPWDWRKKPGDPKVWDTYLKKKIDEAKEATGYDKVDIVAHSMGGLLVRSYIVSGEYRNDINRFAMAGTPNHGTYLAYPSWEGGDVILCDNMKGDSGIWKEGDGNTYFHSQVLNKMYKQKNDSDMIRFELRYGVNTVPEMIIDASKSRQFIRENAPLLRTVMPYKPCFLYELETHTCKTIDGDESKNNFLPDLNDKMNLLDQKIGLGNVRIFGSDSEDTVYRLIVKNNPESVYEPWEPFYFEKKTDGDNLTSVDDLSLPGVLTVNSKDCEHAKLIDCYRDDIIDFLSFGRALATIQDVRAFGDEASNATTTFGLSVDHGITLLVTGPGGGQNGVAADGQLVNQSEGVEVYRTMDGMSIHFENPAAGNYEISMSWLINDKADVTLVASNLGNGEEREVSLYLNGAQRRFTVKLDPAADPMLSLQMPISPPHELKAESVSGNTRISWQAPINQQPASYRIYSRAETEAFFTLLATVDGATLNFQTAHPFETPRRLYTISSVDAGVNESILSETIGNSLEVSITHNYIDTDGDGLLDAIEDAITCLDKADADTDDDGIKDGDEDKNHNGMVDTGETSPCNPDSDNDGIQDGTELGVTLPVPDPDGVAGPLLGTDTTKFQPDLDPTTQTDPLNADTDGDGVKDGDEDKNHNGRVDEGETNPVVKAALPVFFPVKGKDGNAAVIFIQ